MGGKIGCKFGEYGWIGKKRKGQDSNNRDAGGVGFLVKEFLCNIVEVIEDTKHDESIWSRVRGERGEGSETFFLGKHVHAPRVQEYGQRDTEEVRKDSSRSTK